MPDFILAHVSSFNGDEIVASRPLQQAVSTAKLVAKMFQGSAFMSCYLFFWR